MLRKSDIIIFNIISRIHDSDIQIQINCEKRVKIIILIII